jgi:flavin reductase (DIM6/NTAB) family NADH-FMN oxidoreductase RutF
MKDDDPQRQLAAALGRIPSGIFILTIAKGDIETGMLASWVMQCSFSPPQVTVAVRRDREIMTLLTKDAAFTLNVLESSQTDMIAHFGKGFAMGDDAFAGLDVRRQPPRGAVLNEALAYLECQVADRFPAGDHDVFVARVTAGAVLDEGQPMVHVRKNGMHY